MPDRSSRESVSWSIPASRQPMQVIVTNVCIPDLEISPRIEFIKTIECRRVLIGGLVFRIRSIVNDFP